MLPPWGKTLYFLFSHCKKTVKWKKNWVDIQEDKIFIIWKNKIYSLYSFLLSIFQLLGVLGVLFCVATFLGANMKMNVSIRKVKQMPYKEEASKSNTGWCVIILEKGKETL